MYGIIICRPGPVADQQWFGWSSESDAAGRSTHEWAPTGGSAYEVLAVRSDRSYSYDKAGRLVKVDDITGNDPGTASCQRRTYGFGVNGNRTGQATATNTATCGDTGATSVTRAFDTADRPISGANGAGVYVADLLGRQTSIPAADTANPSRGDMALSYYDTDAAKSVSQGDVNVTFTLDGAGRRLTQTTSQGSVVLGTQTSSSLVRHYTDDSDNPSWSVDTTGGVSMTSRYLGLTGDGLGLTVATTGSDTKAVLDLAGPRGDIVASTTLAGTDAAGGIDQWGEYSEYGTPTGTPQPGIAYGWLGTHERATLTSLGITLMGARLFNQATGLFTSLDPVHGGNQTTYGYPNDPINANDISGMWRMSWGWTAKWSGRASTVLSYAAPVCSWCGVASVGLGLTSAYAYRRAGNHRAARRALGQWTLHTETTTTHHRTYAAARAAQLTHPERIGSVIEAA